MEGPEKLFDQESGNWTVFLGKTLMCYIGTYFWLKRPSTIAYNFQFDQDDRSFLRYVHFKDDPLWTWLLTYQMTSWRTFQWQRWTQENQFVLRIQVGSRQHKEQLKVKYLQWWTDLCPSQVQSQHCPTIDPNLGQLMASFAKNRVKSDENGP